MKVLPDNWPAKLGLGKPDKNPWEKAEEKLAGWELRVAISAAKCFGNCPLSFENGMYVSNLINIWTFLSALSGLWAILFWIMYGSESAFHHHLLYWPNGNEGSMKKLEESLKVDPTVNRSSLSVLLVALPVTMLVPVVNGIWRVLAGWYNVKILQKFLNNWIVFDRRLDACWPFQNGRLLWRENTQAKFVNLYFFQIRRSSFYIFLVAVIPSLTGFAQLWFRKDVIQGEGAWLKILFHLNIITQLVVCDVSDDVLQLLILQSMANAFQKIKCRMESWRTVDVITADKLKEWRKLIEMARKQCDIACQFQTPTQLVFVFRCILKITLTVFVLIKLPSSNPQTRRTSIMWTMSVMLLAFRLIFKIRAAENVMNSEAVLVDEIAQIEVNTADVATFQQLQFTHNLLYQNPIQVSYGNCVVLNRSLLLSIFTQVTTYLIVLMQFVQQ